MKTASLILLASLLSASTAMAGLADIDPATRPRFVDPVFIESYRRDPSELTPPLPEQQADLRRDDLRRYGEVLIQPDTGTPEDFAICLAGHPANPIGVDVCAGLTLSGLKTLSTHAFGRKDFVSKRNPSTGQGFTLSIGPGAGLRHMKYCPYRACESSNGGEILLSAQAIAWVSKHLGFVLQFDAGANVTWSTEYDVTVATIQFPLRAMMGVAF